MSKTEETQEMKAPRHWRTRPDEFAEVWAEIAEQLRTNPALEAKTIFEAIKRQYPDRFADGQLRTLQRRIKTWRAPEGPAQELYFVQEHRPGELCESDFTHLTELGITVAGEPFAHMLYHFVLTYSNWETGTICRVSGGDRRSTREFVMGSSDAENSGAAIRPNGGLLNSRANFRRFRPMTRFSIRREMCLNFSPVSISGSTPFCAPRHGTLWGRLARTCAAGSSTRQHQSVIS